MNITVMTIREILSIQLCLQIKNLQRLSLKNDEKIHDIINKMMVNLDKHLIKTNPTNI